MRLRLGVSRDYRSVQILGPSEAEAWGRDQEAQQMLQLLRADWSTLTEL